MVQEGVMQEELVQKRVMQEELMRLRANCKSKSLDSAPTSSGICP